MPSQICQSTKTSCRGTAEAFGGAAQPAYRRQLDSGHGKRGGIVVEPLEIGCIKSPRAFRLNWLFGRVVEPTAVVKSTANTFR